MVPQKHKLLSLEDKAYFIFLKRRSKIFIIYAEAKMDGLVVMVEKKDLAEVLEVQKAAFAPIALKSERPDIAPMTETIEQITGDFERMTMFKYTLNGKIAGSVRACPDGNGDCYIGRLSVHPYHQRKGIGQSLMFAVHDMYKDCRGFILFTAKDSVKNISFYNKLGYTIVSSRNEFGVDMVNMRRDNAKFRHV